MTTTKKASRPARLAEEIEAAGWAVERHKDGPTRAIRAQRDDGQVVIVRFIRNAAGRDVFDFGEHYKGVERYELLSVSEALKIVHTPVAVPFKMTAPDAEVLAAVAGKCVEWRNRMTNKIERGEVPRGGMHVSLKHPTVPGYPSGERILSFASSDGSGFRSVRLDEIVRVS